MKTIAFTAQPFGFGPVSKILTIADQLGDVRKIFFGTGVAYDLAKLHAFDEVHELNLSDETAIRGLLQHCDLCLNAMWFPLGSLVKSVGCPYYLVDSLLYFWPSKPAGVEDADRYFCQNFFTPIEEKVKDYGLTNATIIGPIIDESIRCAEKKDQVVVNFGGLENPYVEIGKNSNYPFAMLKILLPLLQQRFRHILVTGRERVMALCRQTFTAYPSVSFSMLNHREMAKELAQSKVLLTAPGIQSFFDAANNVPVFMLPPQNNSNARNLDLLITQGVIRHYLRWNDLYDFPLHGQTTQDEEWEISIILDCIRRFENSPQDQWILRDRIAYFLADESTWPQLIETQVAAVKRLGPSGARTIIDAISAILYAEKRCDTGVYQPTFSI
ncbi:MAG: hypothetical protein HY731_13715 [Candidatus Tectomicrobia bacterium]|nr:hypothetical protein [Candidatus Tectomicrobia bacterium]